MALGAVASRSDFLLPGEPGEDTYISKSPWYLTKNNGDVLIWKRGVRLRGSDSKSVGPVKSVKACPKLEKFAIEVS